MIVTDWDPFRAKKARLMFDKFEVDARFRQERWNVLRFIELPPRIPMPFPQESLRSCCLLKCHPVCGSHNQICPARWRAQWRPPLNREYYMARSEECLECLPHPTSLLQSTSIRSLRRPF